MNDMLRDCDCYQIVQGSVLRSKITPTKEIKCIKLIKVYYRNTGEVLGNFRITGGVFWDGKKTFTLNQKSLYTSNWSTECFPLKQCPVCSKGTVYQYVS
jgi:hypothetical protein